MRRGGSNPEPETTSMTLTRAHELLIVATDGVWDAVTEAEAVNLVGNAATPADGCQQVRMGLLMELSCLHPTVFSSYDQAWQPECLSGVCLSRWQLARSIC